MAAAAIFNFRKMSITPDWMKIFEPNLVQILNFTLFTHQNGQIQNLKIQDAGCRHLGFLGYVKFLKKWQ